jgi:hypothetical protein
MVPGLKIQIGINNDVKNCSKLTHIFKKVKASENLAVIHTQLKLGAFRLDPFKTPGPALIMVADNGCRFKSKLLIY